MAAYKQQLLIQMNLSHMLNTVRYDVIKINSSLTDSVIFTQTGSVMGGGYPEVCHEADLHHVHRSPAELSLN